MKSWLIGKDSDAGRDWGQEEKGTTEDEMAGWHHWLDGCEFEWTLGVGDGQGGLACCSSWGPKESDTNEQLNWTELIPIYAYVVLHAHVSGVCLVVCVCVCVNISLFPWMELLWKTTHGKINLLMLHTCLEVVFYQFWVERVNRWPTVEPVYSGCHYSKWGNTILLRLGKGWLRKDELKLEPNLN